MAFSLNFDFKVCMVGVQETINPTTMKKDLLIVLQRIYDDKPPSKEVFVLTLAAASKKNFLNFLEMKTIEDFNK